MTGRARQLWNLAITRSWRWLPGPTLTDETWLAAPHRHRVLFDLRVFGPIAAWKQMRQ